MARPIAAPSEPHRWQESVLSTRSLSYMSTVSAFGTPSRAPSYALPQTMEEPEPPSKVLPDSVASSPLFALPREIRDRIYTYCLEGKMAESTFQWFEWPPNRPIKYGVVPQLLRTCKAVFIEATPTLYSTNEFSFSHPSDANVFVRAMTSPHHSDLITLLSLSMRAQDARLWSPYITSSNAARSLRHDFPCLRELTIQYKSNKWHIDHPVEANIRNWSEDKNLEELIVALRNTYFPGSRDLIDEYIDDERPARPKFPIIKVICLCRASAAQFSIIATSRSIDEPSYVPHALQNVLGSRSTPLVEEGEVFRGFTIADLASKASRAIVGAATPAYIARTVFADKDNIQLALEVFCLEALPV